MLCNENDNYNIAAIDFNMKCKIIYISKVLKILSDIFKQSFHINNRFGFIDYYSHNSIPCANVLS
jgi:hypothetical protein